MRLWRVFWLVEAGLLMVLGYQIVSNPPALIGVLTGSLALTIGGHVRFWRPFWLGFGGIALLVSVFINPTIWVMLFIAAVAAMHLLSGPAGVAPWQQKHFLAVTTKAPTAKAHTSRRHAWFGDTTVGASQFDWDDINMTVAVGDTIIDLGNTFLPPGDSTIVIRKGLGKTRILVPVGVGVMVSHAALFGHLTVDGQEAQLRNQTLVQYSTNYDEAPRRIRILTNVVVGDAEVLLV